MHPKRRLRATFTKRALISCTSLLLLLAFAVQPVSARSPEKLTPQVPGVTTTCPAMNHARAPVMGPVSTGSHPTIVYTYTATNGSGDPQTGYLKRYDTVTQTKTILASVLHAAIEHAQVSANGKYVLFTSTVANHAALQLIRIDGHLQQTLYCAPGNQSIFALQWSPDQHWLIFSVGPGLGAPSLYLLNMQNGALQKELIPGTYLGYTPKLWLDNGHIYLVSFVPNSDAPLQNLFLLSLSKGANQHDNQLQHVLPINTYCWDFDTSANHSRLYTSHCSTPMMGEMVGPGIIWQHHTNGNSTQLLFKDGHDAITTLRTLNSSTILLLIHTLSAHGPGPHNGLWKLHLNPLHLERLTTEGAQAISTLNPESQTSWSNVSRNGQRYALVSDTYPPNLHVLQVGSLSGGNPITIAQTASGILTLAGWTTF